MYSQPDIIAKITILFDMVILFASPCQGFCFPCVTQASISLCNVTQTDRNMTLKTLHMTEQTACGLTITPDLDPPEHHFLDFNPDFNGLPMDLIDHLAKAVFCGH